jgi:hypothetical protein
MNDSFNLREFLYNNPLLEKKKAKKKKKDEEMDAPEMEAPEMDAPEAPEMTAPETPEMDFSNLGDGTDTGDVAEIEKHLIAAHEASKKLNDEKLVDQIGNTITYFNRAHIAQTTTPPAPKTISN